MKGKKPVEDAKVELAIAKEALCVVYSRASVNILAMHRAIEGVTACKASW